MKHGLLAGLDTQISFEYSESELNVAKLIELIVKHQVEDHNQSPLRNVFFLSTPLLLETTKEHIKSSAVNRYQPQKYIDEAIGKFKQGDYLLFINGEKANSIEQNLPTAINIEVQLINIK